ncbi:hypothetical protein DFH06DRAFT_1130513 [Mycena polygramma]|nr:hypothetical protein DFH06DRAFT_1130513 [Mycena polygramma]
MTKHSAGEKSRRDEEEADWEDRVGEEHAEEEDIRWGRDPLPSLANVLPGAYPDGTGCGLVAILPNMAPISGKNLLSEFRRTCSSPQALAASHDDSGVLLVDVLSSREWDTGFCEASLYTLTLGGLNIHIGSVLASCRGPHTRLVITHQAVPRPFHAFPRPMYCPPLHYIRVLPMRVARAKHASSPAVLAAHDVNVNARASESCLMRLDGVLVIQLAQYSVFQDRTVPSRSSAKQIGNPMPKPANFWTFLGGNLTPKEVLPDEGSFSFRLLVLVAIREFEKRKQRSQKAPAADLPAAHSCWHLTPLVNTDSDVGSYQPGSVSVKILVSSLPVRELQSLSKFRATTIHDSGHTGRGHRHRIILRCLVRNGCTLDSPKQRYDVSARIVLVENGNLRRLISHVRSHGGLTFGRPAIMRIPVLQFIKGNWVVPFGSMMRPKTRRTRARTANTLMN